MDEKGRWTNRLCISAIVLAVLVFVLTVDGLAFMGMKYVFHLDLSQDYRQVKAAGQLRFWSGLDKMVYIRYPFGLRPIEKREDIPLEEKPALTWPDRSVYDVTDSGEMAAWYDWKEDKIFLGNVEGEIQDSYDVLYDCEKVAFSPDGRYLLYYEIEYGGEITDDEYCYYRVIDLGEGTQYTVYSGYREWFLVYWERE